MHSSVAQDKELNNFAFDRQSLSRRHLNMPLDCVVVRR